MKLFYERNIVGTGIMIFMIVMSTFIGVTLMQSERPEGDATPWFVMAMPLLGIVIGGWMRVTVSAEELKLRFLLGVPRLTLKVAEIDALRPTRGWRATGFGASVSTSRGRYCIAGPSAVSILMRNGRTFLIGVPDPEKLAKAVERAKARSGAAEA